MVLLQCGLIRGWFQYRMVSLQRWSHYRGGLNTEVVSIQGGLNTEVVSIQGGLIRHTVKRSQLRMFLCTSASSKSYNFRGALRVWLIVLYDYPC